MEGVVQLINRLQGAATLLGDNAAGDKSLPSLWSMLPSIVVIGGQVREALDFAICGFHVVGNLIILWGLECASFGLLATLW